MKIFKIFYLLVLISNPKILDAQVLNGVWKGNYDKRLYNNPIALIFDLSIYNDSIISGSSHLIYNHKDYEHHKLEGFYNKRDSTLRFSESLVESSREAYEVSYKMKLIETDSNYVLIGKWHPKKTFLKNLSIFNKVSLTKNKNNESYKKNQKNKDIRIEKVQKIIEISKKENDSIKISLYDNGTFDNDSVTVFLDDSVIINHQLISEKPIEIYISLKKDRQFQKIKLFANNVGTIPPNTALLIVETKTKKYPITMTSDFKNTGIIEFVLLDYIEKNDF